MPETDSKIVSRWDECYENYKELAAPPPDVEPRMLEITYPSPDSGELVREVIFEDPVKESSEPRLLVPLHAILALKRLCERDFERFRAASSVLSDCRVAYYKELQYLREQLQAATRIETPSTMMMDDYVKNYEVYWFNPPSYVDEELKDFLQTCIRLTNKQLIEENYQLRCQAEGTHIDRPGDDTSHLQDLIHKLGPGKVVKRVAAAVASDMDNLKVVADFETTIIELARNIEGFEREEPREKIKVQTIDKPAPTATLDKGMLEELELLRKKARDAEDLKRRYLELQQTYDEAMRNWEADGAKAASELERLLAQERAQTARLKTELAKSSKTATAPSHDPEMLELQSLLPQLAKRIRAVSMQVGTGATLGTPAGTRSGNAGAMSGTAGARSGASGGSSGPDGVSGIADASGGTSGMNGDPSGTGSSFGGAGSGGSAEVGARSGMAGASGGSAAGASNLHAGAKSGLFSSAGGVSQLDEAVTMLEHALLNSSKPSESALEKELRERLRRAQEENAKLKSETKRLQSQLDAEGQERRVLDEPIVDPALEKEVERLQAELAALDGKLHAAEDSVRKLRARIEELQTLAMRKDAKIWELKEEIKRLKHKAGEPIDDDSDDDIDGDDSDLPDWMKAYWRRAKHSVKPRWKLLNEDAAIANMMREQIICNRLSFSGGQVDVQAALEFLRCQAGTDEVISGESAAGPLNVQRTPSPKTIERNDDSISPMVVYQETPVSSTGRCRQGSARSQALLEELGRLGEAPVALQKRQASPVSSAPQVETSRGGLHTLKVMAPPLIGASMEQSTARRTPSCGPLLGEGELTVRQSEADSGAVRARGGAQEDGELAARLAAAAPRLPRATSASLGKPRQNQAFDAAAAPVNAPDVVLSPTNALTGFTVGELVGTFSVAESSSSTAEPSAFLLAGPSVATSTDCAGDALHWEQPDEGASRARPGIRRPATAVPQKAAAAHQDAPFGPTVTAMSRSSSKSRLAGAGGSQGLTSPSLPSPHELWQKRPATAGGQQPLRHESPALGPRPFSEQRCRSAGLLRPKRELAALPGAVWRPSTLPITNAPATGAGQRTGRSPVGVSSSVGSRPGRGGRESGGVSPARPSQATEAAVRILDSGISSRALPARSGAGDENLGKGPVLLPGVSPAMPPGRVRKSAPTPSWLLPP